MSSFDEIRFYYELMWEQSTEKINEYEAQVMKGMDYCLQGWYQSTIKDQMTEDEDGRNNPTQHDQIMNIKSNNKGKS